MNVGVLPYSVVHGVKSLKKPTRHVLDKLLLGLGTMGTDLGVLPVYVVNDEQLHTNPQTCRGQGKGGHVHTCT